MKRYTKKAATTVLADEVLFTEKQKEAVLRKERVIAFGGQVSVNRSETDEFTVGLSINSEYVHVHEGDYIVYDEFGKASARSKQSFESEYEEVPAEEVPAEKVQKKK